MKKITTTIKTMLLAVVVLVLAQACIPTAPTGNPTPSLTGKIKSSKISYDINGTIVSANYYFTYDAAGKLIVMKTVSPVLTVVDSVEYQTDKVIFKQANTNNYTVYFLKPGTNLIDSLDEYSSGIPILKKIIERDNSNNLVSISNRVLPSLYQSIIVDSFIYNNGNIISYKVTNQIGGLVETKRYQYTYDLTKTKNAGIEVNHIETQQLSAMASVNNIDVKFLGLSVGNTYANAISSLNWTHNDNAVVPTDTTGTISYSYSIFTATNISVDYIGQLQLPNSYQLPSKIDNVYY